MRIEIEDEVVVFDDADSAVYTDEVPEDAIIEDGVSSDSIDTGEALIVNLGGKVNEVLVNGESVVENKVAQITLSKVGQTNDYNDLDNKPDVDAIKDDLNETKEQLDLVRKGQTSNSTAINGLQSDVLTLKADVAKIDLSNYYKKSETYSKDEVNTLVNNISSFNVKIVSQLPTTEISTTTIYLIAKKDSQSNDYYDEYLYINNKWELIGTTKVDLADYYNKTEIDAKVGELEADVSDLQDQIAESGGTTVKVGGVAVAEFNADSKADANTVEQQGTKVTELDAKLVSLATQVATDYYNKTDADGKFATKDQIASQDNTTLQSANSYTDTKIADLVDTAPETLDTLGEVAKAIKDNQDVVNALNSAIGNKVDKTLKINGQPLTQNIVLTAEDVGALSDIPDGYVTTDTLNSAMEKKVDKVDGKGLSTNDFTNADKSKLNMLMNYDDTSLNTRVTSLENTKANAIDLADVIDNKTAIGSDARGTKLGYGSIASEATSMSIGYKATTSKGYSVAIGHEATVAGLRSVGVGYGVVINTAARESVALGMFASVGEGDTVDNAVQIGRGRNIQSNTLQIFGDNIYNHETHTMDVQNLKQNGVGVLTENTKINNTFQCSRATRNLYSGKLGTSAVKMFDTATLLSKIGKTQSELLAQGVNIIWVTVTCYQYDADTTQLSVYTNTWGDSATIYTQLSTNARSNGNSFVIPMSVTNTSDTLYFKAYSGEASTFRAYLETISYAHTETLSTFSW